MVDGRVPPVAERHIFEADGAADACAHRTRAHLNLAITVIHSTAGQRRLRRGAAWPRGATGTASAHQPSHAAHGSGDVDRTCKVIILHFLVERYPLSWLCIMAGPDLVRPST